MSDFSALIKPASSLCNLRCKYCFYADESSLRQTPSYGIMSEDTFKKIIDRAYEYTRSGTVTFAFQGGEPTVAQPDFFRAFTEYATAEKPEKVTLNFSIQTNGILLDDAWCELFKKYDFLVGLSIDGPREIHDKNRVYPSGEGSFAQVIKAMNLLKKHKVEFNILSVLTKHAAKHPQQLWNFYVKNGIDYVQFIPCLAPYENSDSFDYTLTQKDYAQFLKVFFRIWSEELLKNNYISVRLFDNLVRMAMGEMPEMCGMMGACSAQFVIEADGSVYPCDFYALDKYLCGNIKDMTVAQLSECETVRNFLIESLQKSTMCGKCKFFGICKGGCRRYREFYTRGSENCPYAEFLEYSYKRIMDIAEIVKSQK